MPQAEKREIHPVFLRFGNFDLAQNLLLCLLAELRGAALFVLRSKVSIAKKCKMSSAKNRHPKDAGFQIGPKMSRHIQRQGFAAEDVEMHMLYALTAVLTAVIYNTVTVCKTE